MRSALLVLALTFTSTAALADVPNLSPEEMAEASARANKPGTLGDACSEKADCVTGLRCKDGQCAQPAVSYATYKTVHLAAVLTLMLALGGMIFLSLSKTEDKRLARLAMILHGLALLVVLVGGFGLMARLNIQHGEPWPNWIRTKFAIWFAIGAFVMVPKRLPSWNRFLWPAALILAAVAASAAIHKWLVNPSGSRAIPSDPSAERPPRSGRWSRPAAPW